ncbi:hypothetical protein D9M68_628720 [compost metagenome]
MLTCRICLSSKLLDTLLIEVKATFKLEVDGQIDQELETQRRLRKWGSAHRV